MNSDPSAVRNAVMRLYSIYTQLDPAGRGRGTLLSAATEAQPGWPPALLPAGARLDAYLRAVSCLLANNLADATAPLLSALALEAARLWRDAHGVDEPPEYLVFLLWDARNAAQVSDSVLLRLFGELLLVTLDLLLLAHPGAHERFSADVEAQREALFNSGEDLD